MLGLGLGVASLVGRYLGAEQPDAGRARVCSAFAMSLVYMLALRPRLRAGRPALLLAPYARGRSRRRSRRVAEIATVLLRFVALYSIFDMMNVVFAAGLKGAGDTLYPLRLTFVLSWMLLLVPGYVLCVVRSAGVYTAWWTGDRLRGPAGAADVSPLPRGALEVAARDRARTLPMLSEERARDSRTGRRSVAARRRRRRLGGIP